MITKEKLKKLGFDVSKPQKTNRPEGAAARLRYWAKNCEKLAKLMEQVKAGETESQHTQDRWGDVGMCGTKACALGHAAIFNIIPGLQWTIDLSTDLGGTLPADRLRKALNEYGTRSQEFLALPVVDGKCLDEWADAGVYCFGDEAHFRVFRNSDLSTAAVIERLREVAHEYRAEAKSIR